MNDDEPQPHSTAAEQREQSNVLTGNVLAVLKQLRSLSVVGIIAAMGVLVSDHYILKSTVKSLETLVQAQIEKDKRLSALETVTVTLVANGQNIENRTQGLEQRVYHRP